MAKIQYTLVSNSFPIDWDLSVDGRYAANFDGSTYIVLDLQSGGTKSLAVVDPTAIASVSPCLSRDGQLLAYVTYDSDADIFTFHVWNTATGVVSDVYALHKSAAFFDVIDLAFSPDSRFVYFATSEIGPSHLERIDLQSGAVDVPITTDGETTAIISDNGRYTVESESSGVYRYDLQTQAKVLISPNSPNTTPSTASLSGDGRFVLYYGVLHDMDTGESRSIYTSSSGSSGNGFSTNAVISADGSRVAFVTTDSVVSPGADANHKHIVIKNIATGAVTFVADAGTDTYVLRISADGLEVEFTTRNQLVSSDTNTSDNTYVARLVAPDITIDTISGDGFVNTLEAQFPVTVTGTSDAIGKTVHITSPNGSTATALVQADGTWTAQFVDVAGTAEGIRNFTADVVDDSTLHGTASKSADFDYTPPALVLDAVAGDNVVARRELSAITIDGSSDAYGQQVSLSIDHHSIGHALVGSDGQWSFVYDGTGLSDGQHEIEFSVDDAAGNVTDRSIFFDKVTPHNAAPTFYVGGGYVVTHVGEAHSASVGSLAIQADGKIVVGGSEGSDLFSDAAVRYGTDGQLDASFGDGGIAIGKFGDAFSIAVQPDGKIILGGSSAISTTFQLQRFNVDGTLDPGFGNGGLVETNVKTYGSALSIVLDGTKIIAVGQAITAPTFDNDFALVRYLADGSLDPTFGTGGIVTTDFGTQLGSAEVAMSVVVQSDGKIVVGGESGDSFEGSFTLARYNDNGTLDANFGTGGKVITDLGSHGGSVGQIQLQTDGKILVAGGTYDGHHFDFELARYNTNGSLDTSFSGDGKVTTSLVSGDDRATSVVIQPDGKIIVGGWALISEFDANAAHEFALIRYNANGSVDTTFGDAGVVLTEIGLWSEGMSVKVQADGKVVIAGTTINADLTSRDFAVARYNPDGSLDREFGGTNTLGNEVSFTEGGDGVVLDATAKIFDSDLAALSLGLGNYGGASVTLARSGGANADDVFGASGSLGLVSGNVQLGAVTVGSFTQSGGQLAITFGDGATQAEVNGVLDAITYANSAHGFAPGTTVQIAWTFSDGNSGLQGLGGAGTTAGITTVDLIPETKLGLALAIDSGKADDDGITNVGTVNVTHLTPGATWSYSTDGGAHFTPGTGTDFTLTGDGPKDVLVQEIDSGNVIDTATIAFTLNTIATAPGAALATDSGIDGDGITNVGTVNVSGLEAGAAWEYSVNGGGFVAGTGSGFTLTGDGPKALLVHQIDKAGNLSSNASLTVTLDSQAPDTTITAKPPTLSNAALASFSWSGADTVGGTGVVGYQYQLDGGVWTPTTSTSQTFSALAEGSHSFKVAAIDAAGNTDASPDSFDWTVDTQTPVDSDPPDTAITAKPAAFSRATSATFGWSGTDTAGGSGVVGYQYQLDGGPWTKTALASQTFSGLSDGSHSFKVAAIDAVGNIDASPDSFGWTVDTQAPDTTITAKPPALSNLSFPTFSWSGTDTAGGSGVASYQYQMDNGDWVPTTSTSQTVFGVFDGNHTFRVEAIDAAGNIDPSPASYSWTVDMTGPITQTTSELLNKKGTVTLAGTSEPNTKVDIFEYATKIGTTTATASGSWTFTTGKVADVIHIFYALGTDAAGNGTGSTNEAILGTTVNDRLAGTTASDVIIGGAGGDTLSGDLGNDVFVFQDTGDSAPKRAAFDTIADFVHGSDKLDFSAIAGLNSNNQNVAINIINNGSTPQSIAAHTIDIVVNGNNTIIYANAGNSSQTISNGHEDMQINLTGVTNLSASDFILHP